MYRTLLISALAIGAVATAQESVSNSSSPLAQANMYAREIPTEYVGTVNTPGDYQGFHPGFGFDGVAFVGIRGGEKDYYSPTMVGLELTGALYVTPKQALTISLILAHGSKGDKTWYDRREHETFATHDYGRTDIGLLAGYRFSQPIGQYVRFTIGGKAGLDLQYFALNDKEHYRWDWDDERYTDDYDESTLSAGFGYAGYAELGFRVAEDSFVTVGYQFHGATTQPSLYSHGFKREINTKPMLWHEIRVGFSARF